MFSDEWALVAKLKVYGLALNTFDGTSDYEQRKERVRAAIKHGKIESTECWRIKGQSQSFAQAFETAYAEKL